MTDELRSRFMSADGTTVSGRTICAYAAVFNRWTEIHDQDGDYKERIAPGAFRDGLAQRAGRIFCVYNHGRNLDFTPSAEHSVPYGRPEVSREDHHGWYTETLVNEGPAGDRLLQAARNKALKGQSFTGYFLRTTPPKPPGGYRRDPVTGQLPEVTRHEIMPVEYGLTPIPAYVDAEVVGVRSEEAGRAESTHGGPAEYSKHDGEDVQCPTCLKYNDDDAEFCDQCGAALPGWGQPHSKKDGEDVPCPSCGGWNMPDARYCDQCGRMLPNSAYDAAQAASSSGRQPAGTERAVPDEERSARAELVLCDYFGWTPGQLRSMDYSHDELKLLEAACRLDSGKKKGGPPRPYGDVEYADPKNGKYPIDAEHVEAAWAYINKPENAAKYPLNGVTLAEVKGRIKAAMKKHGHEVSEDDDSKPESTSSSGRQPEFQAAASRGGAEPQARSASNDRSTHGGGSTMPEQTMSVEERAARQAEIRRRQEELNAEFAGAALPADRQAEWDALVAEDGMHEEAIRSQTARTQYLRAIADRQGGGIPGYDTDSGYGDQAADDQGRPRPEARTGNGFGGNLIPSPRQLDKDIWDMASARTYARTVDDLPQIYRERAMRVLEFGRFPAEPARNREDVQARVEGLLNRYDDPSGFVAQRILSTGSPVYQRAFGKILAKGIESLSSEEQLALQRALTVGTPASWGPGSYPVPYQIDPTVTLTSNGAINAIRQIARTEQIVGREWLGVTSTGVVVTRGVEPPPTGATGVADATASPFAMNQPGVAATAVRAFVPFSVETEQDWNGLLAEISMMLADAKDIEEAGSFLTGNGTAPNPQGILTGISGAPQQVLTATTAVTSISDVYNVETQMAPRFRAQASFLGSKGGYNGLRQLWTQVASAAGDPWVRPSAGTPPEFLGYPAYENSNMSASVTTSASQPLVLGDWKQFLIVDRIGMSVELVPHLFATAAAPGVGFPTGQRGVFAMWRNNSAVLVPNAFRYLQVR